jgi:hypothetical protein
LNGKEFIEWIAEYVANEGYDIASYNSKADREHNRFIEVKSYAGSRPYFYGQIMNIWLPNKDGKAIGYIWSTEMKLVTMIIFRLCYKTLMKAF